MEIDIFFFLEEAYITIYFRAYDDTILKDLYFLFITI